MILALLSCAGLNTTISVVTFSVKLALLSIAASLSFFVLVQANRATQHNRITK